MPRPKGSKDKSPRTRSRGINPRVKTSIYIKPKALEYLLTVADSYGKAVECLIEDHRINQLCEFP